MNIIETRAAYAARLDEGGPQFNLLSLTSAFLSNLTVTDLGTWTETDRDDTDGLLREIIRLATEARPALVAGIPDPPAGADIWARADQLTDGNPVGERDPAADRAIRLLAATVQAFENAGLTDGSHFIGMCEHVWGIEPDSDRADVLDRDTALRTLRDELLIGRTSAYAIVTQASDEAFGYSWSADFSPPRQGATLSYHRVTVHAVRNVPHGDDITGFRIRYYT